MRTVRHFEPLPNEGQPAARPNCGFVASIVLPLRFCRKHLPPGANVAAGNQGRLYCDPVRASPVRVGVSPTDIA